MASQSDRNRVAALHTTTVPSNLRDASGSSTPTWSHLPTEVYPPGHGQRKLSARQSAKSPFDGRLRSNFGPGIGNVVSSKTFLVPGHPPPSKRQKLNPTGHGTRAARETQANGKGKATDHKDKFLEIIHVDDDDDMGERVDRRRSSPDPINIIPVGVHPFETSEQPRRLTKSDGYSTTAYKKAFLDKKKQVEAAENAESDGIESAGFFDDDHSLQSKPGSLTAPGNVRKRVKYYEMSETKTRSIDLADEGRKKDRMQKKVPSGDISRPTLQRDLIATSSSGFNHGGAKRLNGLRLPIDAWYFGTKYFPDNPRFWLQIDGNSLIVKQEFSAAKSLYPVKFRLDRELLALQYTLEGPKQDRDTVILHFTTAKSDRKATTSSHRDHFTPGGDDGKLTFKLASSHKDWTSDTYQKSVTQLRKKIDDSASLDACASASLWEAVERSTSSRKRKQTHQSPEPSASRSRTELNEVPQNDHATVSTSSSVEDIFANPAVFEAALHRSDREKARNDHATLSTSRSDSRAASHRPDQVSRHFQPQKGETSKKRTPVIVLDQISTPPSKGAGEDSVESLVLRRSTRQSKHQSAPASPLADPDELILVYPPDTAGAVNITNADLSRLEPNEFLNDTLIEFGLKLWLNQLRVANPELAESIHVFSSFFYKKLNNKNLAVGYQSVRKWTSKIDLFKKKYIIVPINEHLHWYLAVIYHPEHVLLPPPYQAPRLSVSTRGRAALAGQGSGEPIQSKPPPLRDASAEIVSPHVASDLQQEAEVSALLGFGQSCSLGQEDSDNEKSMHSASSSTSTKAVDPIIAMPDVAEDAFSDNMTLQYPSSPCGPDIMDIDAPSEAPSPMHEPGVRQRSISTVPETIDSESSVGKPAPNGAKRQAVGVDNGRATVLNNGVAVTSFYGSGFSKGKQKHPLNTQNGAEVEQEVDELLSSPEPTKTTEPPVTYIFTLDSLGTRHPQAIKVLKQYLIMEAKDKKGIRDSSEARGKQALVPVQPNYCDCGLYLLHFAETFMKNPDHYYNIVLTRKNSSHISERQADWDDAGVGGLREKLTAKVIELSQQWKRDRAAQTGGKEAEKVESSDDDIDIVEDLQNLVAPPSKGKGKGKAPVSKAKVPAQRLR